MFESAELGHKLKKVVYERELPALRDSLLAAQGAILEAKKFPVIVLIGGVDGAGKGETVNLLNEWMDPRHIQTHAMGAPTDEERLRPPMWRHWRALPPKGKTGIFFGSWYSDPIVDRATGKTKNVDLDRSIDSIARFERMLADEGALLVKFWFHLSKARQKKRLEALESDPLTAWRVTKEDWERHRNYAKFRAVSERTLRQTSTPYAPWTIVEGWDTHYRAMTVGKTLLEAMEKRIAEKEPRPSAPARVGIVPHVDDLNVLAALDLDAKVERAKYDVALPQAQARLHELTRHKRFRHRSLVLAFEGADAAGKGGAIRRVSTAFDARVAKVIPVAAPTEEERAQPYLWRFWRNVPRLGQVTIFDRTWYGRVLVERVEGFCSEADWRRAYGEINDFEESLERSGAIVVKFWLQISKDEQGRRFKEREKTSFKKFKITDEDWRNRKKWDAYQTAVCDMVERTSTEVAPWTLVEANDKYHARVKVAETVVRALEDALHLRR
ncbi:MAG: polyphosphate:AMP phosphotransferase [Polyangiaceae bacterium]